LAGKKADFLLRLQAEEVLFDGETPTQFPRSLGHTRQAEMAALAHYQLGIEAKPAILDLEESELDVLHRLGTAPGLLPMPASRA
jgi:hypothetical protein